MPVHIQEINVQGLGPLPEFHTQLGRVNLIYGCNECGKTYLVEFIIRSLFKKAEKAGFKNLRSMDARGEVHVCGIDPKPIPFTTGRKSRKLEDCLPCPNEGLPPSLAQLLVVRAGELALAQKPGGVSRTILKEYLSNEGFLDAVQDKIPPNTTQSGHLNANGEIIGNNKGDIKEHDDLRNRLSAIDQLFIRLQEIYSGGSRAVLQARLVETQSAQDQMEQARRFKSFKLSGEIERLEREKKQLPRADLDRLELDLRQCLTKAADLDWKETQRQEKEARCAHYPWLEAAIGVYKSCSSVQTAEKQSNILLILAGVAMLAAVVCSFLNFPAWTLISSALAAILVWLYWRKNIEVLSRAADIKERDSIAAEFTSRFGISCSGLASLEEKHKTLEPEWVAADLLKNELEREIPQLKALKESIAKEFKRLTDGSLDEDKWEYAMQGLREHLSELEEQYQQQSWEQARLDVDPADHCIEDPGITYDATEHNLLIDQLEDITRNLKEETDVLADLKREIADQTGDDLSVEWETLIGNLKAKRAELSQQYRAITAQISAGILVNEALSTFREREDENIRIGLQSDCVKEPLKRLTGRYEQLELEGDQLTVSDLYSRFALADLSTGAQEQVLLALRIGFARKLMSQDALFLILDDAFQHSDWHRREKLVDEMVGLARDGWQVIYFSMDDHIRDLFESRVKPVLGEQYRYIELE